MTDASEEPLDLVWGLEEMARLLKRTPRQVGSLIEKGALPGVRKLNGRYCTTRRNLFAPFEGVISEPEVGR